MNAKITITNVERAPNWETLQQLVRECTRESDGYFTKIDRRDAKCDYRQIGTYDLMFHVDRFKKFEPNIVIETIKITLFVEGK